MCDVPSIAVFCNESIECFPGTAPKFFLKLLVTIPVAPIIIGIIVHFRFHIRCIVVSRGGRIADVVLEWKWESNLGLRLGGEGLLTPINNSFVEHRVYWEWI